MLVKYLLGETDSGEDRAVKEWIADDVANQEYFEQFKLIWDSSKLLAQHSTADENAAWIRFQERVSSKPQQSVPAIRKHYSWLRIAASVILLAGVGFLGFLLFNNNHTPRQLAVVTQDEVIKDTLPDGSMVTLNKRSSLSYPEKFRGSSRPVTLSGEAFFNVAPNKSKPFVIQVGDVEVTVVGTSFNVKSGKAATEIVVETGIVRVSKGDYSIELHAGERTTIAEDDQPFTKKPVTDKLYNYYRTRQFACEGTPLWKLVDVVNEAYDVHIVIGREELRNEPIVVTFNNESLEQVLNVICLTHRITYSRNGDQIILQ